MLPIRIETPITILVIISKIKNNFCKNLGIIVNKTSTFAVLSSNINKLEPKNAAYTAKIDTNSNTQAIENLKNTLNPICKRIINNIKIPNDPIITQNL